LIFYCDVALSGRCFDLIVDVVAVAVAVVVDDVVVDDVVVDVVEAVVGFGDDDDDVAVGIDFPLVHFLDVFLHAAAMNQRVLTRCHLLNTHACSIQQISAMVKLLMSQHVLMTMMMMMMTAEARMPKTKPHAALIVVDCHSSSAHSATALVVASPVEEEAIHEISADNIINISSLAYILHS
jgi:hypothetical protein